MSPDLLCLFLNQAKRGFITICEPGYFFLHSVKKSAINSDILKWQEMLTNFKIEFILF